MILTPLELPDLVDWSDPLSDDPLNAGLVAGYLAVPNAMGWGSLTWRDMLGRNHGTLTNGPTWTGETHRGGFGSMRFDGNNDIVNTNSQILGGTEPAFSLSAWVNFSSFGVMIIANFTTSGIFGFRAGLLAHTSGGNRFHFSVNSFSSSAFSDNTPTAGRWYHVAGVYDSAITDKCKIYVDGKSQTATNVATLQDITGYDFAIGARNNGPDLVFNGRIDAVFLFNRALTASEIAARYERESRYYDGLLNRYDTMAAAVGGVTSAWRYYQQFAEART